VLKACLNGPRDPAVHPALPVRPERLASDAVDCVRAGADAIHLHPRGPDGRESLDAGIVDAVVERVAAACGAPVGVATGAWIEPDPDRRTALVAAWRAPAFASVNLAEDGAAPVMRALLDAGIGIEAGVWTVEEADALADTGLAGRVLRVLVEPMDGDPIAAAHRAKAIDERLDAHGIAAPRVHHGEGPATWAVLRQAVELGHGIRVGLEDTLVLPDGTRASGNAELVAAAAALRAAAARSAR
jgi:uncharacterized protein (DUF849 family)